MKIILASASKRRHDLMNLINIPYEVIVSDDDEVYNHDLNLYEQCVDISYHKALNVYKRTNGNRIIIGSDTIVVYENKIYGKPKDKNEAIKMLEMLSGKCHEVVTSLSVIVDNNGEYKEEKVYETTKVFIDDLSYDEIIDWVNSHNVCDMAGAYAIQEEFGKYITKIEGDYFTIVGFPLNKVYRIVNKYLNK